MGETIKEKITRLGGVETGEGKRLPGHLHFRFPNRDGEALAARLDLFGVCVSAGSACAKGHRSHVMTAMKLPPEVIDGSFRVSICRDTTQEELDKLVDVIQNEILPMRR